MLFESYVFLVRVNWVAAFWKIAVHSANDMCSKYKYLIVSLSFPHLAF